MRKKSGQSLTGLFLIAGALWVSSCREDYQYIENPGPRPPLMDQLDGQFPIVGWTGINADESAVKFPSMKEAGFNVYLGWYDNLTEATSVLETAEDVGVKVILSCPELDMNTETTVQEMAEYSSLYGYYIDDEPEVEEFSTLSKRVSKIQSFDTEHPCYINLYPNWAWGGPENYSYKVRTFLKKVPVPFLSFDYYPIIEVNGVSSLRPDWYRNLEDIAAAAKEKNVPFWAFGLALSHTLSDVFYPIPTLAELRLQMFSNLVYGAQGFQYFTYWGVYHDAPTVVYDRVKTVNQELQNLADIFLGANIISVWHTGSEIPAGTHPLGQLPAPIKSLATSDQGAVVSYLEKGDNQYLAIVNRDYKSRMELAITFDPSVKQVLKSEATVEVTNGTVSVDAGDMVLYVWKK